MPYTFTPEEIRVLYRIKDICTELCAPNNGLCPDNADEICPFFTMCQEPPDQWDPEPIPKITEQERRFLICLQELGIETVSNTLDMTPLYQDKKGEWRLLPDGALPSIPYAHNYKISKLLGGKA